MGYMKVPSLVITATSGAYVVALDYFAHTYRQATAMARMDDSKHNRSYTSVWSPTCGPVNF